jgi:hypothetical protein
MTIGTKSPRLYARRILAAAVLSSLVLGSHPALAATSTSGQDFGAACTGGRYTVVLFKEDFENNAISRWILSRSLNGRGAFEIGRPQSSRDANGLWQLGYTPSEQLDPRFWIQGPNALVTGLALGWGTTDLDLDGSTTAKTWGFSIPSGRTTYLDFSYYFAHDGVSSASDYFNFNFQIPQGLVPLFSEAGSPTRDQASWIKKTISFDSQGLRGFSGNLAISVNDASPHNLTEAAVDDILVYYCQ